MPPCYFTYFAHLRFDVAQPTAAPRNASAAPGRCHYEARAPLKKAIDGDSLPLAC